MIILTGDTRSRTLVARLQHWGIGRIFIERRFTPYPDEPWAFDNAAFTYFRRGKVWTHSEFLARLERAQELESAPLFGVVPDVVGHPASLWVSLSYRKSVLQEVPWPWYLAVQDGMSEGMVRVVLPHFDGIFLGGTDTFKTETAARWCRLAHRFGKQFHYARAGTPRKLRHAFQVRADSLDSAFFLWNQERFETFVAELDWLHTRELEER